MMRSIARKFAAVTAMISILSLSVPQAALAYDSSDYVPAGSCGAEVAEAQAAGAGADDIAHALSYPWVYRFEYEGMAQFPPVLLAIARHSEAYAAQAQRSSLDAAKGRLGACAFRTAAANVNVLVQRLAPNGLVHRVTRADCVHEQEAFAAAFDEAQRFVSPPPPASFAREIAAGFVEGVAYNHVLFNHGRGMTPDVYKGLSTPEKYHGTELAKAEDALRTCVYSLADQRGGGASAVVASNTAIAAPAAPADPCVDDKLAALNNDLAGVEARLERFMSDSPYVKADGLKNATPMLQVTIWGLEQNIAALKKHCAASQMARERIIDLESSLTHAMAACDQIQAGGGKCVGVEPEQVG